MALDDLKETIETLRERIQAYRAYLEGHETRTRQVLIDPMLRVLGWDIENLDSVQLEHTIAVLNDLRGFGFFPILLVCFLMLVVFQEFFYGFGFVFIGVYRE